MKPVFLTGATGFVGRRVVAALAARPEVRDVRVLVRPASAPALPSIPPAWHVVEGDLLHPDGWTRALRGSATLLHLAALTGKARRAAHWAHNVQATRRLLAAAADAHVSRVVFVSSIAAGYRDRWRYHYAEAKAQAEDDVRAASLDWLVIRPTLVLGPGSALLGGLRRLATLPRPVLFGPGQPTQPIHVDDLAAVLTAAVERAGLGRTTMEIGGPDVVDLADLLDRLRAEAGLPLRRPLHLPLHPTRLLLAALEPVALAALPFTAGQLALFANPSVAAPHALHESLPRPQRDLAEMLRSSTPA